MDDPKADLLCLLTGVMSRLFCLLPLDKCLSGANPWPLVSKRLSGENNI